MTFEKFKALLVVVGMFCVQAIGMAATPQDPEAMLDALLRPTGWRAEWQGPGGAGITEIVFQRQSDKIIAKIRLITPFELTCENPVTVGLGNVTFDGCRDPALNLIFYPEEQDIPFRGKSPRGYEWKLRAK